MSEEIRGWEARLIPVSGKRSKAEQEHVTTSAFLAVLREVKEFRDALLKPLGAPSGREVSTFCEATFDVPPPGKWVNVDGLIKIVRGQKTWTLLVEVKTGKWKVRKDQAVKYLDVAKANEFAGLLTISNELVPVRKAHPVDIDQRRYGSVALHHLSWARVLATALQVQDQGVKDPEQGWILSELIRYLEDEGSGVLTFDDLGPEWTKTVEAVRHDRLRHDDENAFTVAARWDQLLQHISLTLAGHHGVAIRPLLKPKEARDLSIRTSALTREMADEDTLSARLKILGAPGPLEVRVNLNSMVASASIAVDAPDNAYATTRVNWLLRQLKPSPKFDLHMNVAFERSSWKASEPLEHVRRNPQTVLEGTSRRPRSFTIVHKRRVGGNRFRKSPQSFIRGMENLVSEFYEKVVQDLKA